MALAPLHEAYVSKISVAGVLVQYYAGKFKRCIDERIPFSQKSYSKLENVCGKSTLINNF